MHHGKIESGLLLLSAMCCCGGWTCYQKSKSPGEQILPRHPVAATGDRPLANPAPWKQLKAWAARDPRAALAWLAEQDEKTQFSRAEEAWRGAIHSPELAMEIGAGMIAKLPAELAAHHGLWLTDLLVDAGMTDQAMEFSLSSSQNLSGEWLSTIVCREAAHSPKSAAVLWQQMPAGEAKQNAWIHLASAWASQDSAGLCAYADALPSTAPERSDALNQGGRAWCLSDPASFAEWLNTVESQDDFNNGLAQLVTLTDSLFRSTTEAFDWAQLITDSDLRLATATSVLREWSGPEPAAVREWILNTHWLDQEARETLLEASFRPAFVRED